jgi:heavy metal sensor kinase
MTWSWRTASIRVRLTAWYAAAMFVMLAAYAAATYAAVRHEFVEQIDDQLGDDMEAAEQGIIDRFDGGERFRDPDANEDRLRAVEIWSDDGQVIARSSGAALLPDTPPNRPARAGTYASVTIGDDAWRTLTAPAVRDGRPVIIRVARSEARARAQIREVLVVLVLGLPFVVGLSGVGGYVLARRALAPIDRLTSEARRLTADRLHERLTVPNERDEIGRLAVVINDAVARLELSFDQLRRFTADASHELRTPLAVIRGIGEVGASGTRTPDQYKDAIGSMLEEVDRLATLVDTLLRLSHADAGAVPLSRETVDLGNLVREVHASLAPLAEERHQDVEIRTDGRALVVADRLLLREAITNVLHNAIKYGPEHSRIELEVSATPDAAIVTIADQGPGIPPEHRSRIFDRFFRVDQDRSRERGGSGLGLAIAKWAVDVNQGRISVDGTPPGGAIFRIELPLMDRGALPAASQQSSSTYKRSTS